MHSPSEKTLSHALPLCLPVLELLFFNPSTPVSGLLKESPCLRSLQLPNSSFIFHLCHIHAHPQSRTYKSSDLPTLLNPNLPTNLWGPYYLALPGAASDLPAPDTHSRNLLTSLPGQPLPPPSVSLSLALMTSLPSSDYSL